MNEKADGTVTPSYSIRQRLQAYDSGNISFPRPYLLYCSRGTLRLETGDRMWLLPPERAAWIPANASVRIVATGFVETASIAFSHGVDTLAGEGCTVFHLSALAREMILHTMQWNDLNRAWDVDSERFYRCVADVCRDLATRPITLWLPLAVSTIALRATEYILTHLGSDLSSSTVAAAAYSTPRSLARCFRRELNLSPGQFIQKARILKAMELLGHTDQTVTEICYSLGLTSVGSFETAFKNLVQLTPLQYRKGLARKEKAR